MKRILALFGLLMLALPVEGQNRKIVVQSFDTNVLDMRARTAPRYDNNAGVAALVSIVAADSVVIKGNIIGAPVYLPGEVIVYMPDGSREMEIVVKGCRPLKYTFPEQLMGSYAYRMEVETVAKSHSLRTLILGSYSYNKAQPSGSIMLALAGRDGGYVRLKTDFDLNFGLNPQYACDDQGMVDGEIGWFTGNTKRGRLAITGGYIRQIAEPFYLYAGGGWGRRILAWEMYVGGDEYYDWARVESTSYIGYEVELGAILRLGNFAISAGVQTNGFKYYELNAGIGVMF